MCSLRNATASAAEGKERLGELSSSFGQVNVSPGALEEVDVGATDFLGAVAGSHAARTATTASQTMRLLLRKSSCPLDRKS